MGQSCSAHIDEHFLFVPVPPLKRRESIGRSSVVRNSTYNVTQLELPESSDNATSTRRGVDAAIDHGVVEVMGGCHHPTCDILNQSDRAEVRFVCSLLRWLSMQTVCPLVVEP